MSHADQSSSKTCNNNEYLWDIGILSLKNVNEAKAFFNFYFNSRKYGQTSVHSSPLAVQGIRSRHNYDRKPKSATYSRPRTGTVTSNFSPAEAFLKQ